MLKDSLGRLFVTILGTATDPIPPGSQYGTNGYAYAANGSLLMVIHNTPIHDTCFINNNLCRLDGVVIFNGNPIVSYNQGMPFSRQDCLVCKLDGAPSFYNAGFAFGDNGKLCITNTLS